MTNQNVITPKKWHHHITATVHTFSKLFNTCTDNSCIKHATIWILHWQQLYKIQHKIIHIILRQRSIRIVRIVLILKSEDMHSVSVAGTCEIWRVGTECKTVDCNTATQKQLHSQHYQHISKRTCSLHVVFATSLYCIITLYLTIV